MTINVAIVVSIFAFMPDIRTKVSSEGQRSHDEEHQTAPGIPVHRAAHDAASCGSWFRASAPSTPPRCFKIVSETLPENLT